MDNFVQEEKRCNFYSQEDCYFVGHFDTKNYSLTTKCARIVDKWISLPFEVCLAFSVDKFKANVIKFVTKLLISLQFK